MKEKVYRGGIPTDGDVKALMRAYPTENLVSGGIIPHNEIEELIKCRKYETRYRSITSRWRSIVLSESNVIIGVARGIGFKILTEPEKVDLSGAKLRMAANAMTRSRVVSAKIDRRQLTQEERKRQESIDLYAQKAAAILQVRGIQIDFEEEPKPVAGKIRKVK